MDFELDTEKFIEEVRLRPILWNPAAEGYRDGPKSKEAWTSIAAVLSPNVLNKQRKEELSKELQKKWRNIRDSFLRSERTREGVSRIERGKVKIKLKYRYANHLEFLKNFVMVSPRLYKKEVNEEDYEDEHQDSGMLKIEENSISSNDMATKTEESRLSLGESFDYQTPTVQAESFDDDVCFFKSLLPTVKQLDIHRKMSFRISVMSLLQDQLREQMVKPQYSSSSS